MGLDMYLKGHDCSDTSHYEKVAYWRKHPDLHGYIVQNFANGVDDCKPIELTLQNIKDILQAVKDNKLPYTTGFFFGQSDKSYDEYTINIFSDLIDKMQSNPKYKVMYQASW